jgi:DNA-binding Xre family transcriptional regulator
MFNSLEISKEELYKLEDVKVAGITFEVLLKVVQEYV